MDICGDRLVLAMVPVERIAALSPDARDPAQSPRWAKAGMVPRHDGSVEGVLALRPDLVVMSAWAPGRERAMFDRLGVAVHGYGMPHSFDEIRTETRRAATALDAETRGEAWIATMDEVLARAARAAPVHRPATAYVLPGGLSAGSNTPVDAVMNAVGLDNIVARIGFHGWGVLPLERLVAAEPDMMIIGTFDDGERMATRIIRHPVLNALPGVRRARIGNRDWLCGDPDIAGAVAALSDLGRETASRGTAP